MSENRHEGVAQINTAPTSRLHDRPREGYELVEAVFRQAAEQAKVAPSAPVARRGVHHTELPQAGAGEPLAEEWDTYRREIGRWLAEGLEGRHVLIKGAEVVGLFETVEVATEEGLKRYPLQPFFVHPIRAEEPFLRIRGVNHPCPGSRLP